MEDIDLLPDAMRARSLSDREVVLSHDDALKALDILLEAGWAFLAWEGWGKYNDGTIGHCDYQGTVGIEKKADESWSDYAKRGYDFVKETIEQDYKDWEKSEHVKEYELYFCITAVSEEDYIKLKN